MHCHGPWRIGNRPVGVRIEDMTIADTRPGHISVAIATRGQSTAPEFQEACCTAGAIHIFDCNVPRRAILPWAGNA